MDLTLGYSYLIIEYAKEKGVLRNQLAYILATAYWETAGTMHPVKEAYYLKDKYSWSEEKMEAWRKRNLRYYPWYGRGFVQLTWEDNYIRAGSELGIDLTSKPDKVMDPVISAKILVRGMMEGWFTGKKVPDYITLARSDFLNARRIVNLMDQADDIAAIARKYDKALKEAGYGEEGDTSSPDAAVIPKPIPRPAPEAVQEMVAKAEKPMTESKTNWLTAVLGSLGSIAAVVSGLHPIVQGILIVGIFAAAGLVFWERKKHADRAKAAREAVEAGE